MIANHGRLYKYEHVYEGRNSRLDTIQAAVLNVKLSYLDEWNQARIDVARLYEQYLKEIEFIKLPKKEKWAKHVYHLFVIRTSQRDKIRNILKKHDIETGIHYPVSLPKLSAYSYLKKSNEDKFAWNVGAELLSLPIGEHITVADVSKTKDIICKNY